jgi:hypothetical protein
MAKTNAERQRDWRRRQRERMIPADAFEAWKAETRRWGEAARDEIARLEEELASSGSRCPRHRIALECRECSRGEDC